MSKTTHQVKSIEYFIKELFNSYRKQNKLFLDDVYEIPKDGGFLSVTATHKITTSVSHDAKYYLASEQIVAFKNKYSDELRDIDEELHVDIYAYISHFLFIAYKANPQTFTIPLGVLFEAFGVAFFLIQNEK